MGLRIPSSLGLTWKQISITIHEVCYENPHKDMHVAWIGMTLRHVIPDSMATSMLIGVRARGNGKITWVWCTPIDFLFASLVHRELHAHRPGNPAILESGMAEWWELSRNNHSITVFFVLTTEELLAGQTPKATWKVEQHKYFALGRANYEDYSRMDTKKAHSEFKFEVKRSPSPAVA